MSSGEARAILRTDAEREQRRAEAWHMLEERLALMGVVGAPSPTQDAAAKACVRRVMSDEWETGVAVAVSKVAP